MNIPPLSSLKLYAKQESGYAKKKDFIRGKLKIDNKYVVIKRCWYLREFRRVKQYI